MDRIPHPIVFLIRVMQNPQNLPLTKVKIKIVTDLSRLTMQLISIDIRVQFGMLLNISE